MNDRNSKQKPSKAWGFPLRMIDSFTHGNIQLAKTPGIVIDWLPRSQLANSSRGSQDKLKHLVSDRTRQLCVIFFQLFLLEGMCLRLPQVPYNIFLPS